MEGEDMGRRRLYDGVEVVSISLPRELLKTLDTYAKENGLSRSRAVIFLLSKALKTDVGLSAAADPKIGEAITRILEQKKTTILLGLLKARGAYFTTLLNNYTETLTAEVEREIFLEGRVPDTATVRELVRQQLAALLRENRDLEELIEELEFLASVRQHHPAELLVFYLHDFQKRMSAKKFARLKAAAERLFSVEFNEPKILAKQKTAPREE